MTTRSHSAFGRRRLAIALSAVVLGIGLSLSGALAAHAAGKCEQDSGANFAEKTPSVAQLSKVSLRCADFRSANLSNLSFEQADLTGADFRQAIISKSDFSQANLTDADFSRATLTGTSFEQATMGGVTLAGVHAGHADFEQVDLSGVSLKDAQLSNADFSQATLTRADLSRADLREASFNQTDLTGANLRGSDIAGADLTEATTTGSQSAGIVGLPPLDLFAAIIVLVVALLALRPRLAAGARGRGAAWLVILVFAALTAAQAVAALGWQPTADALFVLPFLTPIVFIAIFVGRATRRPKDGWPAAGIAVMALLGLYLLTTAGLAFGTDDLFGLFPFSDACSAINCGDGVARGPLGIVFGLALIVVAAILSRSKALARPLPDIARWEALQTGSPLPAGGNVSVPPPNQTI